MNKIKLIAIGSIACIAGVLADYKVDQYTGELIRVTVDDDGRVKTYNLDTGEINRGQIDDDNRGNIYPSSGGRQRVDLNDDGSIRSIRTTR